MDASGFTTMAARERDMSLDFGRCVAALLVVYIHFTVNYVGSYPSVPLYDWWVANAFNSIGRVCVPLFIMMSGALVIGKPVKSWPEFFRKRSANTLKPYVFGTVLYFVWQAGHGIYPISAFEYAKAVILGGGFFHLYFLFILLALYITTPLLQGFDKVSTSVLVGVVTTLFVIDAVDRHIQPWGLTLGYLALGNCMSYLPYFLAGYLLYRRGNVLGKYAGIGFVVTSIITASVTWMLYAYPIGPYTADNVVQYTSLNVILQSLFAFSLLLKVRIRSHAANRLIGWLSATALGVYIIHFVIVSEMQTLLAPLNVPLMAQLVFYPLLGFTISSALVWGAHKVPGVKGFI